MAEGGHLKKNGHPKNLWARYLMNHCLDRIQIFCSCSLGISNDLINFWEESIKNKMDDEGHFEKISEISYEPLVGLHSYLSCSPGIPTDLINFWE